MLFFVLESQNKKSIIPPNTVASWMGSSTSSWLETATKRSLLAMRENRARGPSREPGCHMLGCRGPLVCGRHM